MEGAAETSLLMRSPSSAHVSRRKKNFFSSVSGSSVNTEGYLAITFAAASAETCARSATSAGRIVFSTSLVSAFGYLRSIARVAKAPKQHSTRKNSYAAPRRSVLRSPSASSGSAADAPAADASSRVGGTGETSITRALSRILTPSRDSACVANASAGRTPATSVSQVNRARTSSASARSRRGSRDAARAAAAALRPAPPAARGCLKNANVRREVSSMSAATRANPCPFRARSVRASVSAEKPTSVVRKRSAEATRRSARNVSRLALAARSLVDRSSRSTVSTASTVSTVSTSFMSFTESFTESFTDESRSFSVSSFETSARTSAGLETSAASVSPIGMPVAASTSTATRSTTAAFLVSSRASSSESPASREARADVSAAARVDMRSVVSREPRPRAGVSAHHRTCRA